MDSAPENAVPASPAGSPGAILSAERERQGLARGDIAQRLHMSVSQVEALEAGDYARLPRGTFLRGFTRNYARALGLDADPIVGLLAEDAPREKSPVIVVPSQNIRFDPLGQRLASPYVKAAGIAFAAIVLGFAAMYWWLFIRPQGVPASQVVKAPAVAEAPKAVAVEPRAEEPKPPAAEQAPAPAAAPAVAPAPVSHPAPETAPPKTVVAAAAVPAAAQPAVAAAPAPAAAATEAARAPAPGEGVIRLSFRGAAWVEITDARGKILLSRTHPGGSSTEVVGKGPFGVVIGNAPEVHLNFNGRDVDLAPYTRVAVARFTLK